MLFEINSQKINLVAYKTYNKSNNIDNKMTSLLSLLIVFLCLYEIHSFKLNKLSISKLRGGSSTSSSTSGLL